MNPYAAPTAECDLVLKGGITSGVVYPPAVLELAPKFRFRNIGGASAGAIAAALTAAAEYGREGERAGGGFAGLDEVKDWLAEGTHLFDLFQPNPRTQPLYRALLAVNQSLAESEKRRKGRARKSRTSAKSPEKPGWLKMVVTLAPPIMMRALPVPFWVGALIGAAILGGVAFGFAAGVGLARWGGLVLALAGVLCGGWLGGVLASVAGLWRIAQQELPKNLFGICSGRATGAPSEAPALTEWLHEKIQTLAGRSLDDPPLTVGDLAAKRGPNGEDRGIRLRTISTNLSHAQPYALPFDSEFFLYSEADLGRIFPKAVVDHLVRNARELKRVDLGGLPGFHALPWGRNLPVVMLARLSLSFPILLSAVPLYCIRHEAFAKKRVSRVDPDGNTRTVSVFDDPASDLQRVWFSDGGISSNFPIHFFDVWLPGRPTFGINLTSYPEESFEGGRDADPAENPAARARLRASLLGAVRTGTDETFNGERRGKGPAVEPFEDLPDDPQEALSDAVQLPPANRPLYPPQVEIATLGSFLAAIWTTAQNYRDSTQARLPSYRERIVQIAFAPDEGGLNLAMGRKEIDSILLKGQRAGQLLHEFDFDRHRWVRLRVLMAELEQQLDLLEGVLADPEHYEALLLTRVQHAYPYSKDADWRREAVEWLKELQALAARLDRRREAWKEAHPSERSPYFFQETMPRPEPVLRVTPRL